MRKPKHMVPMATEAKQEMHHYLVDLVAATSDAMIVVNENFQVRAINPAAATTFGWSAEDAIGHRCTEVLKCRNSHHIELCGTSDCPLIRVLSQKRALPNEELLIGIKPAHTCNVSVSITPVDTDEGSSVVFNARDMSALKSANRVRANFVSMVSHELRTPLNSVHGFIDLLLHGHMGPLAEEQHKYLGYTQEGVQQLISIVEDILFMTRSDSGQFEINSQEVDISALVKQVIRSLEPQARKADVLLQVDLPTPSPLLYADPLRMKQVLNNLATNAIKFTPPGGTVTTRVCPYDEHLVMIAVSDTGCGIRVEDRQHIFERFYQSNRSHQSKVGGYGLGLPIAKLIVEQHGGSIWFDTVLNDGTTFYFTAPTHSPQ